MIDTEDDAAQVELTLPDLALLPGRVARGWALAAIMSLRPSQRLIYYRGELGHDSIPNRQREPAEPPAEATADEIAAHAAALIRVRAHNAMADARASAVKDLAFVMLMAGTAEDTQVSIDPPQWGLGLGYLTQRRRGPVPAKKNGVGEFDYIFTRISAGAGPAAAGAQAQEAA